jgi:hypothetical protein
MLGTIDNRRLFEEIQGSLLLGAVTSVSDTVADAGNPQPVSDDPGLSHPQFPFLEPSRRGLSKRGEASAGGAQRRGVRACRSGEVVVELDGTLALWMGSHALPHS